MKFQRKTNPEETVKFALWGADGSQEPRKVKTALETIKMTIVGDKGAEEKVDVFRHESRTKVTYYYAKLGGKWMWTRDPVAGAKYEVFKKPEPAPKAEKQTTGKKAETKADGKSATSDKGKETAPKADAKGKTENAEAPAPKQPAQQQASSSAAK